MADGNKIRDFEFFVKNGPNWPMFFAIVGGVAAAVVVGLLVGLPALRIRGVQLAVVTLAAVVAIEEMLLRNLWLFGDGSDSTNPMPVARIGDTSLSGFNVETNQTDNWRYTVFLLIMVAIVGLIVVNLRRGAIGRRFLAVRANERAAAAAGINVANTKMLGFGISSAIAGLAGVMFSFKLSALTSESFSPFFGLALLAFVYLGGITTSYGAIAGGMLVAGGISAEFGAIHFDGVTQAIINLIGAIGLIVNAIATSSRMGAPATKYITPQPKSTSAACPKSGCRASMKTMASVTTKLSRRPGGPLIS
jgi:branched-chain amino acid transport system permease protein